MGAPPPDSRLRVMAITDRRMAGGTDKLIQRCTALCEAGLPALMLREKDLDGRQLFEIAVRLRPVARRTQTLFIVNDRIDVAMAVRADGAHLGGLSIPIGGARRFAHQPFLIGVSCHCREDLLHAQREGADYALLSPVFHPKSKGTSATPLGVEGFQDQTAGLGIPVLALGGVDATSANELVSAGAAGLAAIGAFMGRERAAIVVEEMLKAVRP